MSVLSAEDINSFSSIDIELEHTDMILEWMKSNVPKKKSKTPIFRIPNTYTVGESSDSGKNDYKKFIKSFKSEYKQEYKTKFHFRSYTEGKHRPYVSLSSINQAINNNIHNAEVWVYCNKMKVVRYRDNDGRFQVKTLFDVKTRNFSLDIDNHPVHRTINDIKKWFMDSVGGLPFHISKTGDEGNFHIVINGPSKVWTDQGISNFLVRLCGIENPGQYDSKSLEELLKNKHGIDFAYLRQNPLKSKYRVPGTPKNDGTYIVTGWSNDKYDYKKLLFSQRKSNKVKPLINRRKIPTKTKGNLIVVNFKKKPKTRNKNIIKSVKDTYSRKLRYELNKHLSKKLTSIMLREITENFGFFKKGNFIGGSRRLAKKYNVSRELIDRAFRKLIKADILIISKEAVYVHTSDTRLATVYGFSSAFSVKLKISTEKKTEEDIAKSEFHKRKREEAIDRVTEHYTRHDEKNAVCLADARMLYVLGASKDDAEYFLNLKMRKVTSKRFKNPSEIYGIVWKFWDIVADIQYTQYRRRNLATFSLDHLLEVYKKKGSDLWSQKSA